MIEKVERPQPISGTLNLAPPPTAGSTLHLRGYLVPAAPDVQTQAFVRDDTGMLLSICSIVGGSVQALGTGFLVAPGLAMTATHVIADYSGTPNGRASSSRRLDSDIVSAAIRDIVTNSSIKGITVRRWLDPV